MLRSDVSLTISSKASTMMVWNMMVFMGKIKGILCTYQKMLRSDVSLTISSKASTIMVWNMMVFMVLASSALSDNANTALLVLV